VIAPIKRREFITLLGGVAFWPLAVRAEQPDRPRRIGVLTGATALVGQTRAAFEEALQKLGWTEGRNIRIDYLSAVGDADRVRSHAAELVAMTPEVLVVTSPPVLRALRQQTHTIPIVFVHVADPVGAGFVKSLAKPGGNVTGFTNFEFSIGGKWLELVKEIAPRIGRVAVLQNPANPSAAGYLRVIDAAAPSIGAQVTAIAAHGAAAATIERGIVTVARASSDSLIVLPDISTTAHRELIVALVARHRLPAIYPYRFFVENGGLISYGPEGPDAPDPYRRVASYVDRILKGEKPADLPVQAPTKYELVINRKTAKTLGLDVPSTMLARADEVIE
jgi:putative tryptophan/tyrosine transport system substrate-binding protein